MKYTVVDTELGITIARLDTPAAVKAFLRAYGQTDGLVIRSRDQRS